MTACRIDDEDRRHATLNYLLCRAEPPIRIADMKPAQVKPPISPELLDQIGIRVGTILTVTDVPESEKLIALQVSFGDHNRTVLVGMKKGARQSARD